MIYLDSSAVVKMIRPEAESRDLVEWLNRRNEPAVTSVLAEVEVPRALRRSGPVYLAAMPGVLASISRVEMDASVRATAGAYVTDALRSLDAVHVATARCWSRRARLDHVAGVGRPVTRRSSGRRHGDVGAGVPVEATARPGSAPWRHAPGSPGLRGLSGAAGGRGGSATHPGAVAVTRALVVAAPASGSGKTTVATGLMAALRRRGTAVAPFKVGPDYIDPGYHTLAAGRPGRNLDPVLVGEHRIAPLFRHGAAGAEVAVVEGVMGLFDGRLADGHGSTAHVAGLLGAPVVLVVDCRGQSRSVAALLHGFRSFDPARRVVGVVLNRVGSDRHEAVLRAACDEVGLPVLGALPRRAELAVPSRHLGLVTAAEHGSAATAAVDGDGRAGGGARRPGRGAPPGRADPARPGLGPRRPSSPNGASAGWSERRVRSIRGRHRAAGGGGRRGSGVHLRLRRAHRAARGRGVRGRRRRPAARRGACPTARPRSCCPAASRRSTSPRCRRTSRCAPPSPISRRPAHRCTPSAAGCSTCARASTGHPCAAVLPADGGDDRPAHPGLPGGGGARRVGAVRRRPASRRTRVPPLRGDSAGGRSAGVGLARRRARGLRDGGVHASFLHTHPAGAPAAVARFARAAARSTSLIVRELSQPPKPR